MFIKIIIEKCEYPHKNTSDDEKSSALASDQNVLSTSLRTMALTSLGTLALVGAHHLGRKQYYPQARLRDYTDGVVDKLQSLKQQWQSTDRSVYVEQEEALQPEASQQHASKSDAQQNALTLTKSHTLTESHALTKSQEPTKSQTVNWVSGVADLQTSQFAAVGIDIQRQIVWQTDLPGRLHDIVIQPQLKRQTGNQRESRQSDYSKVSSAAKSSSEKKSSKQSAHVAVMGRRPSDYFWVLDAATGKMRHHISALSNRHFYGHACYSLDGNYLYVTENDTDHLIGKIGVYDAQSNYKKISEFDSQGVGPHELLMHPDGETLIVAIGGIKTERASRDELNLDSMQPSLVYLSRHDGTLLEQVLPKHRQMSVRHLAVKQDGTVIIGIQFQGERHLNIPLILTHRRGDSQLKPLNMPDDDDRGWHRFHHYIASVALDETSNTVCATSPIGGYAAVFDLNTGMMIDAVNINDCAGVANWSSFSSQAAINASSFIQNDGNMISSTPSFIVSDGLGYLTSLSLEVNKDCANLQSIHEAKTIKIDKVSQALAFDNHLNQVAF